MNALEIYKKYCNDLPVIDVGCGKVCGLSGFYKGEL
jgi:hypothetical protein